MLVQSLLNWNPSGKGPIVNTIDLHTGGEPFRIVLDGMPPVLGDSMLERREYAKTHLDHYRKALMLEPRGHADMYGCILTPPVRKGSSLGVLFIHNAGYSTMCGHGVIALATALVECGFVSPLKRKNVMRFDTPAGTIEATIHVAGSNKVDFVSFLNVPSFTVSLGDRIQVDGYGSVPFDLAFGGAYYAYVDAAAIQLSLDASNVNEIIKAGRAIKETFRKHRTVEHPVDEGLAFLYGVIFTETYTDAALFGKNVCIFADGEVDRSPTGTGVSGRLAIHYAKGEVNWGEEITIESIIGSRFTGSVSDEKTYGSIKAIIPEIKGDAYITGKHQFILDSLDDIGKGFMLR